MPECKLGLNDKVMLQAQNKTGKGKSVELEDIKFHQCVRLARFENDRTISFIPPDGQFDLMNYRITTPHQTAAVGGGERRDRADRGGVHGEAQDPVQGATERDGGGDQAAAAAAADATSPEVKCGLGAVTYAPEQEAMLWKIKTVPGGKEVLMRAKFSLPSVSALEDDGPAQKKPPITVKYEIPYFTVSPRPGSSRQGDREALVPALPWVRYITRSGNYEFSLTWTRVTRGGCDSSHDGMGKIERGASSSVS